MYPPRFREHAAKCQSIAQGQDPYPCLQTMINDRVIHIEFVYQIYHAQFCKEHIPQREHGLVPK